MSSPFDTDTSERRRRTVRDDELAAASQTEVRLDRLEQRAGWSYKIMAGVATVVMTGAGGTALHFSNRAEQMAESRGSERTRLERAERDIERLERELAGLRAIVAGLYPALRNLPVIPPVIGDDR